MRVSTTRNNSRTERVITLSKDNKLFVDHQDQVFSLGHLRYLIFEGSILQHAGHEEEYFKKLFESESADIDTLLTAANGWDGAWVMVYVDPTGYRYAFTDPLGKKQLYYNTDNREISTSISELIYDSPIDLVYKSEIAKWGYNTDNRTPWEKVKRIMPNRLYSLSDKYSCVWCEDRDYMSLMPKRISEAKNPLWFFNLVAESVKRQIDNIGKNEPIGILLSGGIDSSAISYFLLKARAQGTLDGHELKFYTINNAEDAPYVEIFRRKFGIEVTVLNYDMNEIDLIEAMKINETPVDLGSMVPNQFMFKHIPERIIFTGDGPDEMFGGYRRIDEYDSQKSDMLEELSFYHLPRLERAAKYYGKDLRCPWIGYDIIRYALSLPYESRKHKQLMKDAFRGTLPDEILDRPKIPLKNDALRADPIKYRMKLIDMFYSACLTF